MGDVVYTSRVRVERVGGPLRRVEMPGEPEAIYVGAHDEIADHYGRPREGEHVHAATLDYVVAAAAG